MNKTTEEKLIKEAREAILSGLTEVAEEKKVIYDGKTQQFSVKIPKAFALRAKINENSKFGIVLNPVESRDKIEVSELVIYLIKGKDGEGEKTA